MDIRAHLDGSLKPHNAAATLKLDIDRMDWQALHLINERMQTSQNITVHLTTDMANKYSVDASMANITITTPKRTSHPKDLLLGFTTAGDSTRMYLRAGDFDLSLEGDGHITHLSRQAETLMKNFPNNGSINILTRKK